jgi:hypothetical protein
MFILRRLPALIACLLLGALSLRLGLPFPMTVPLTLAALILLFIPKPVAQAVLAALLGAGALAWVAMTWLRVQQRLAEGQPWLRLAVILGVVALFTAWAAWLLLGTGKETSTADGRR